MEGIGILVGHLIGDYVLQNDSMADAKRHSTRVCLTHCVFYTVCMSACNFWWLPWWGAVLCFALHFPVDRYPVVRFWMRANGQSKFARDMGPWSVVVVDNAYHLSCMLVIAVLARIEIYDHRAAMVMYGMLWLSFFATTVICGFLLDDATAGKCPLDNLGPVAPGWERKVTKGVVIDYAAEALSSETVEDRIPPAAVVHFDIIDSEGHHSIKEIELPDMTNDSLDHIRGISALDLTISFDSKRMFNEDELKRLLAILEPCTMFGSKVRKNPVGVSPHEVS